MTHSNHRRGSRESLLGDYIVMTTDRRLKDRSKLTRFMKILLKHNPVGIATSTLVDGTLKRLRYMKGWDSSMDSGVHKITSLEELMEMDDLSAGSGIYTSLGDVKGVLEDLKEAELGIATVVSGIFDVVHKTCLEVGTGPHTVNMSAETYGKMELVAEPKLLEITTMCGHHFVSPHLVKHLIERVKNGSITAEDAAVELGKQCTCNFFNVERAAKLINEYIASR